jgi:hypothetical protein
LNEWVEFGLTMASVVVAGILFAFLFYRVFRRPVAAALLASVTTGFFMTGLAYWIDGGIYWFPLSLVFLAACVEAFVPASITVWVLRRRWQRRAQSNLSGSPKKSWNT